MVDENIARFTKQASVVLDTNGYGTIRFGAAGEEWKIDSIFVSASIVAPNTTVVNEARARVYLNYVGAQYAMDGTFSGSSGDTSDTVHYIKDGQALIIEWMSGDVGSTATAVIRGWRSLPDRGFRAV